MQEKEIEIEIERLLLEKGATFVGFSDVTDVPESKGFRGAITVGIKLLDSYFEDVLSEQMPTYEYFHHYRTVNFALDQLALFCALRLEKEGRRVKMIPASQSSVTDPYRGAFPHKTAAVRANLGFIGKSCLFIHKDYGSRVRLATVLVDEPFSPLLPPCALRCGDCNACRDVCPAHAISGKTFSQGYNREEIFDAKKCSDHMKEAYRHIGRGSVCGLCIAVCPYNHICSSRLMCEKNEGKEVHMRLNAEPFREIESGEKTVEMRLYDEKRKNIRIGDTLVFTEKESGRQLKRRVVGLHREKDFASLLARFPTECGRSGRRIEDIYSAEEVTKYGVVGIQIDILTE